MSDHTLPPGSAERNLLFGVIAMNLDFISRTDLLCALEEWGTERIRDTLALRGIDRELIDAAVGADGDAGAEMDRALEILRLRFPSLPRERRDRDRALAVLLRKGYDTELALDALTAHARAS